MKRTMKRRGRRSVAHAAPRRSRLSRRRQIGGVKKILSQSGCFIYSDDGNYITKYIHSKERFDKEADFVKIVNDIDPEGAFSAKGEPMILTFAEIDADDKKLCNPASEPVYTIRYFNGGMTFSKLFIGLKAMSGFEVRQLVCAIITLMKHVVRFNESGWLHSDINPENIVYRDGVARLIDFEMMKPRPSVYNYAESDLFGISMYLFKIHAIKKDIALLNDLTADLNKFVLSPGPYDNVLAMYKAALDKAAAACLAA